MPATLSLTAGSRLGWYEILSPLGAGGMGEVFRARDTRLDREVALKLLPPDFASDPERLARFEREAKLLAALNHPSVAAIYGLEEADARPFLVLELAQGEDLQARIARGRVPTDEAVAIAKQIAEALEAAHEKGIVHRDLKPANVKVGADGLVKVLDFGLAKAWAGDATGPASGSGALSQSPTLAHGGTEAGLLLGTAAYMAPEQARGKPVDKRADVWAFGAVLFEMLAGRRLFEGETITDVLAAVVRQEIDWNALPAAAPPRLRALLRRCLERDPKLRLRDIGEARIALATPDEPAPAATRTGLSRRSAAVLIAGAGGAFAAGFGLGRRTAPQRGAAKPEGPRPLSITRITSSGNVTSAALSPDGRFVAHVESEQGEQSLWLRQLATGQTLRLAPPRNVFYWGHSFTRDGNAIVFGLKTPDDFDGALYSISTLGGAARRLVAGIDSAPAFSRDGSRMAWVRARHPTPEQSALMIAKADGSEARVLAVVKLPEAFAPIFFTAPDWSPDDRRIAAAVVLLGGERAERGGKVVAVSVETGRVETLAEANWRMVAHVAWLHDGQALLAIARGEGQGLEQVWLVPAAPGTPHPLTRDLLQYRIVSPAADGRSFVTVAADSDGSVWLAPRDGRERPRKVTGSRVDGVYGLSFAPGGRIVYTSVEGGRFGLWVTGADAAERAPLATGDATALAPVVTATGDVYYLARTREGNEIRRTSLDGSPSSLVARDVLEPEFAVSPDGRSLVLRLLEEGEGRLFRLDLAGGSPERLTDYQAFTPAYSPDGTRLAFYYFDASARRLRIGIAPATGGPPATRLDVEPPNYNSRIAFGEDGLYINTISGDRANIWLQPTDGGPPKRITDFQDQLIFEFALSPDGKSLAYSRGSRVRDALLVRDFR